MTEQRHTTAARLLPLIDLTSLNDAHDDDIAALCAAAVTPFGTVAAVCSWPEFTADMVAQLPEDGPKVAVVINFPEGTASPEESAAEAAKAADAGADELDLVMPYGAWLAGDRGLARDTIEAVKAAGGGATLKVILETGSLGLPQTIAEASEDAIAAGADMLKTSSGKTETGATLEAAEAMLTAIRRSARPVGFKASGGIRSLEAAADYLAVADRIMGANWATPKTFRVGASKLLDTVLEELATAGAQ